MNIIPEKFREQLFEWFDLNEKTGKLFWKKRPGKRVQIGSEAGSLKMIGAQRKRQVVVIKFQGKFWFRARLVFLMVHGYLPDSLDHGNGDSTDDRPWNLRPANASENARNRKVREDKIPGLPKGVLFRPRDSKSKPFCARITLNGQEQNLGYFATIFEAENAYKEAARRLHGEFSFQLSGR